MLRNKKIFHILNLLIWIITWLVITAHDYIWLSKDMINASLFFSGAVFTYFTGYLVSCLLYYYLNEYYYKKHAVLSILRLLIVVIVSSELWIWSDFLLTIGYAAIKNVYYELSIKTFVVHRLRLAFLMLSWMGFYLTQKYWFDWLDQRQQTETISTQVKEAKWKVLRYQLNPHFLFNALNSVRALIYKSPKSADEMISKLSDFMRYSLSHKDEFEVPLETEVDIINDYLNIEKTRFGNKLEVNIKVDPIANEFPIPPFLIIPLVENAIKYGTKTSKVPLVLEITAEVDDNELQIAVKNSGHWIDNKVNISDGKTGTGTGLENIKRRLETLYSTKQSFVIKKLKDSVTVEINIFREFSNDGTNEN